MPEWNKLPAEVLEVIVKRATKRTRDALRVCSKRSKLSVEETKLKSLYSILIYERDGKWAISTAHSQDNKKLERFATFEKLQERLTELLKPIDFVERITIFLPISAPPIKLMKSKDQRRLLVENVSIGAIGVASNDQQVNILSQLEPVHLRAITLDSDAQNSKIYDMEQVIHAETLKVNRRSCIREDQLLKLNAHEINFWEVDCSIDEYVKKCASEAVAIPKPPSFQIGASSFSKLGFSEVSTKSSFNKVRLDVPNSQLKFELTLEKYEERSNFVKVYGSLRNESNNNSNWRCDRSLLRTFRLLHISYKNGNWNLKIKSLSSCWKTYKFQQFGEFQEKLDEIMENVDFIKHFLIQMTESKSTIMWKPREKKLMVKKLTVEGNDDIISVKNLLEQIDPNFGMDVTVMRSKNFDNHAYLYDIPQVRKASRINIYHPSITDSQLLEMNHFFFNIGFRAARSSEDFDSIEERCCTSFLTPAGIHQFLKKCVHNVGKTPINFHLGKLLIGFNFDEVLEGLDIIEIYEDRRKLKVVINTAHPDYFLIFQINFISGVSGFVSYRGQMNPCVPFGIR